MRMTFVRRWRQYAEGDVAPESIDIGIRSTLLARGILREENEPQAEPPVAEPETVPPEPADAKENKAIKGRGRKVRAKA